MICGTEGNDSLVGGPGNETIYGLGGNDTIDGGAGADVMIGGPGDDVYYVDNPGDVVVELQNEGIDEVRSTIDYTLPDWVNNLTLIGGALRGFGNSIDNVIVGNGLNNLLVGADGNDTLSGMGGNDWLNGDEGDDYLDGGSGNDTLVGGDGRDTFAFSDVPGAANADVIADFKSGEDRIQLDAGVMPALGAAGPMSPGDTRFSAGPTDANGTVLHFNTTTGQLWYYAQPGSVLVPAQLIFSLGPTQLLATDIVVVRKP